MTVTVEFVSAEDLAKARADLRAMAEEQKRPLPHLVELAMATHNVALQKDPTWLSSFAWAAAVDAIIEECAKEIEKCLETCRDDFDSQYPYKFSAFLMRALKSSPEHGDRVIANVIMTEKMK